MRYSLAKCPLWRDTAFTDTIGDTVSDPFRPTDYFSKRLREIRTKRNLGVKELADKLGVEPTVIVKLEAPGRGKQYGREQVTLEEVLTLSHLLNISPTNMLVPADGGQLLRIGADVFPALLVRAWMYGNDPLDPGDDRADFFGDAPDWEGRHAATYRHPVMTRLETLRGAARAAITEDFEKVEPRLLAKYMREELAKLGAYVELLAQETEEKGQTMSERHGE